MKETERINRLLLVYNLVKNFIFTIGLAAIITYYLSNDYKHPFGIVGLMVVWMIGIVMDIFVKDAFIIKEV